MIYFVFILSIKPQLDTSIIPQFRYTVNTHVIFLKIPVKTFLIFKQFAYFIQFEEAIFSKEF